MIHVAIYEHDTRIAAILAQILERAGTLGGIEQTMSWSEVRKTVAQHTHSVVVLGPETDDADLQHVQRVTRDYPGTAFVYVVDQIDARVLQKAMRHGIRDVVAIDDADPELAAAVTRAHAMVDAEIGARAHGDKAKGKVVTILGPKGGTGKTMVATNLAVLSAKAGISTALLDGSVRFGDCAAVLRVRPERTMADLIGVSGVPDDTILSGVMTSHDSGLKLLCGPNDPLATDNVEPDLFAQTIEGLRHNFELVIVDTGPSFDAYTIGALAASEIAYLVTSLELPAVKDAKLVLSMIDRLRLGGDKIRIVLNRANSKVGFPPDEVAKALGRRSAAQLPSDVAVPRSMNTGVVVAIESAKAKVSKGLVQLAGDMRAELFGKPASSGRRSLLRPAQARTAQS